MIIGVSFAAGVVLLLALAAWWYWRTFVRKPKKAKFEKVQQNDHELAAPGSALAVNEGLSSAATTLSGGRSGGSGKSASAFGNGGSGGGGGGGSGGSCFTSF